MKYVKIKAIVLSFISFLIIVSCSSTDHIFETTSLRIELTQTGQIFKLVDKKNGENYLSDKDNSTLLQVCIDDNTFKPTNASYSKTNIILEFGEINTRISIEYKEKTNYLTFEVVDISTEKDIDKIIWGPIDVTLTDKIGKSIGLAYNDNFGVGLMGLNLKSCGGYESIARERFGNTAERFGNITKLQGFTADRSRVTLNDNCLQELTEVMPVLDSDATIVGSKFAIYGVSSDRLKETISEIEKNENLPYLVHNNEWLKNAHYATSSKFIMSFNAENIEQCLAIAQKSEISCVYHPGIFKSWGLFPVSEKSFPNGYESVLACSNLAKEKGITLGVHTLSNFITKDDKLVTPVPHPNLQLAGVTKLLKNISSEDTEIILANKSVRIAYEKDDLTDIGDRLKRNENKNRETFAIRIDDEIIEFSSVSKEGDLVLYECKRGAYGTVKSAHKAGDKVGRLVSHYYKVFFPDIQLQDQMAKSLAHFFNATKMERISFDGIEGGIAAGHGRYGCDRFIKVFFDNLENKNIIANSSDVMHHSWHYFANQSWGEPWWAKGFRDSQLDHRLKVQKGLEEDLLPRKMGQFSIGAKTTVKDIQWVMGLCAGYDAGVDFYVSPNILKENTVAEKILREIKVWEQVRSAQTLSKEQKQQLRDPHSVYQLKLKNGMPSLIFIESWAPAGGKKQGDNDRNTLLKGILKESKTSSISLDYEHINMQKEPGQPTLSEWKFYCVGKNQSLQFAIRLPKDAVENIKGAYLKLGTLECKIPFTLTPGDYVISQANNRLVHFSKEGKEINAVTTTDLMVEKGENTIQFDYKGKGRVASPKVIVNFKIEK